jgi:FKBP-type peptidyl-prolyl cis-trans isomerase SlyD
MNITKGSRVAVHYILRADGPEGEIIEETRTEEPLEFVIGDGEMLQKFEEALVGLEKGADFTIAIAAEDAYGEEQENLYGEFPKSEFINDEGVMDDELFEEGEIIPMETPEGDVIEGMVVEVKQDSIILDFNHPLADTDLYFEGKVVDVQ